MTTKRPRGRPRKDPAESQAAPAQALDRGLHLLALIASAGASTLSDVALRAGMPASTAHRLLTTMERHGIVTFDGDSQHWTVGLEAFRIGSAFLERTNLVDAARKAMRRLVEETGETANLGIANAGDVVFVSQVETPNPIRAFFPPGTRGSMHASGIGKALLAELSRERVERLLESRGLPEHTAQTLTKPSDLFADLDATKARGWSFDDEERHSGMRCVAAAIFNEHREAIAGISVSGPTVRLPDARIAEVGATVRNTAAEITEQIGGRARRVL